jgi:predicted peroxiredoxin
MPKAALVIFAGTEGREGVGRVANALVTAKEFKETGDDVTIVFDGAGTTWIGTLNDPSHRYHDAFDEVRDRIAGACSYCADRYGVKNRSSRQASRYLTNTSSTRASADCSPTATRW